MGYCGHSDYRPICERCEIAALKSVNSDLLEALEKMVEWANAKPGTYPGGYPGCEAAKAIARAKGEAE